jgi:predicted ATPase
MLVGEMGLGKTRLIEELVQRLVMGSINQAADKAIPCFQLYTGDGQSFKQNIPYITLRTPLSQLIGFTQRQSKRANGQTSQVIEQHIQERIGQLVPELAHFTPLIGDVLGIALTETAITRALSAEQRHSRVQELVVALFRQAASEEPLLLVIDDFQWSDTASREILLRLAQVTQNSPLVLVLSYRPETAIAESWADLPNTGREVLHELTQDESWLLVEAMLQGPPPDTLNHLLLRTQGNPFFIEELVRALVASGVLFQHTDGRWFLASIPDQVSIPTSIEGMIMERLDRLEEPYHALVQIASVIGNRFQLPILQGVYPNTPLLQQGLQYLCDIGILDKEELPQETTYIFHHALLHEVAYEGILYAQRRELHRQVAHCIETLNSESVDEHLMLLAHHYMLAEDWEPAFRYHLSAGVQAQQRYANQEALMLFNTALEIGHKLEQDMQERKERADAQLARARDRRNGPADRRQTVAPRKMVVSCREAHVWDGRHWIVDRRSGPADRRMVERARRGNLRKTPQEPITPYMLNLAEVYERRGDMYILMGEYVQAQEALHQALVLLKRWKEAEIQQQDTESPTHDMGYKRKFALMWVRLHRLLAWVLEYRAEYDEAFTWLKQGIQEASPDTREELARCYVLGASIFHQQGEYDHSLEWAQLGLSVAKELGNTADQAHALLLMGNLWRDQGEFDLSIPVLEQARALLDEMKDATRLGEALQSLGDAYWSVGRWQDALKYYQQSLQMSENIGDVMGQAYASNRLARVMVGRGELEMAYELYQYSGEQFRRVGSLPGLAITGYHHGEVILRKGQARDALHLLRVSISSLERIKARNMLPEVLRLAAEATLELGDYEEASDYLSQALMIASDMGMVAEEAIAWRVMGQIMLHTGDLDTAADHLAHGRNLLEKMNNRYELGKVQYWQAKLAIARGNGEEARALAEQAQSIFQGLRAKRDLQMVKTCLAELTTTYHNKQYDKKTMV